MNEDAYDELLSVYLDSPARDISGLDLSQLNESERNKLESLLNVADDLWDSNHGAPPLSEDPIAAMLGLVADPQNSLSGKALSRLRRRRGLQISQIAERLRERGWKVDTQDVFRWESKSTAEVPPALIVAIADEIGTTTDQITINHVTPRQEELGEMLHHPKFQGLVARWADIQHVAPDIAASALHARALATVHRGQRPDTDQMLTSLESLVEALEAKPE